MSWEEIDVERAREIWKTQKETIVLDVRQEWEYTGP